MPPHARLDPFLSPSLRHIFTLLAGFCTLVLWIATPASAQHTRIAIGAGGGVSAPIGPSDRFAPRWYNPEFTGAQGPTQLVHYRPKPGMAFHVETAIRELNIRYTFQRYQWRKDRVACIPSEQNTGDATRLPNGEYDDRNVLYQCGLDKETVDAKAGRRPLQLHQLSVSYNFVAVRPQIVIPYAKIGGGLLLTTFHTSVQNNNIRLGASIIAGGGLRVPIDRNISLYLETQYALHLMSRGGNYSLRAGRAVAVNHTVLSAIFDPMHSFQAILGIRVRVR